MINNFNNKKNNSNDNISDDENSSDLLKEIQNFIFDDLNIFTWKINNLNNLNN